jgi:hypothetical protein
MPVVLFWLCAAFVVAIVLVDKSIETYSGLLLLMLMIDLEKKLM